MSKTQNLAGVLRTELAESQIRNPAYSMRALARRVGLGVGSLSMVLAGKRQLSAKTSGRILDRLAVNPQLKARILKSSTSLKKTRTSLPYSSTELKADQYTILSEWHYLAILNLIRLPDFEPTAAHVSARLGISVAVAKKSLTRLERVGLVKWEKSKLVRTHISLQTTDDVQNLALKKSHYQTLERARLALDELAIEQRDFTWLTFAFNTSQMPEFKKFIRNLQDEISEQFSMDPAANEVYRLAIQFFPLTKSRPNKRGRDNEEQN